MYGSKRAPGGTGLDDLSSGNGHSTLRRSLHASGAFLQSEVVLKPQRLFAVGAVSILLLASLAILVYYPPTARADPPPQGGGGDSGYEPWYYYVGQLVHSSNV